jgi:two-component sensor histidine kinase
MSGSTTPLACTRTAQPFPDQQGGEILIQLQTNDDDQLTLTVADSGVGLPPELDFRETEFLGLQLVNTLVDQLDGTIELYHNNGTNFKITFSTA